MFLFLELDKCNFFDSKNFSLFSRNYKKKKTLNTTKKKEKQKYSNFFEFHIYNVNEKQKIDNIKLIIYNNSKYIIDKQRILTQKKKKKQYKVKL